MSANYSIIVDMNSPDSVRVAMAMEVKDTKLWLGEQSIVGVQSSMLHAVRSA